MTRIIDHENGKFTVIVEAGRDPGTGKRTRIKRTIKGRKHEAERLALKLLDQVDGGSAKDSKMELKAYLESWFEIHRQNLAATTAATYEAIIKKHITPSIGKVRLKDLTGPILQGYYSLKLGELTARSVQQHHSVLSKALSDAVISRLIAYSPATHVRAPKPAPKANRTLTIAETKDLLKSFQGHRYETLYVTAAYTGMRLGEILALRWEDVNLPKLFVRQSLSRVGGESIISTPKSKRTRQVIVPKTAERLLKKHPRTGKLVFCHEDGTPLTPTVVSKQFIDGASKAGYEMRFHDLRHSYATQLAEMGTNPVVVQQLLGHHDVAFTLNVYTHAFDTMIDDAATKFNQELIGTKRAPNSNGLTGTVKGKGKKSQLNKGS